MFDDDEFDHNDDGDDDDPPQALRVFSYCSEHNFVGAKARTVTGFDPPGQT